MKSRNLPVYGSIFIAAAMLMLINAGAADGQDFPVFTEVSGTYTNSEHGVEVQFPAGWEGIEIVTDVALSVTTAPGGMMSDAPTKLLGFTVVDKSEVQDPTDPSEYTQEADSSCTEPELSSVQMSGRTGYLIAAECTQPDGAVWKFKSASVQTDASWVSLTYMALDEEYAVDEGAFDSTLASIRVDGAMDVDLTGVDVVGSGSTTELELSVQSVTIDGEQVSLDVRSSSTISEFQLDEENKRLSFMVDGDDGTEGTTEIAIGGILEGPYTVMIDGETSTNFEVIEGSNSSETMLVISYTHSVHEITVTGTNVVPEFPVTAIAAVAAVIGVVAVLGRTRMFKPF